MVTSRMAWLARMVTSRLAWLARMVTSRLAWLDRGEARHGLGARARRARGARVRRRAAERLHAWPLPHGRSVLALGLVLLC